MPKGTPDKKPLVNMWVGLIGMLILLISTAISFAQCNEAHQATEEAHHANERADKEAAEKHDATVRAETAERIAKEGQEKLSTANQTASTEKQRAEALEKSRKDDARIAADALKAQQTKAADAQKELKALQAQNAQDRASIAAFAEDYFWHLSQIKKALSRYIDKRNTMGAVDAAGDLKAQIRSFGDFVNSWVQVHTAMNPLLDHYIEQILIIAMNNQTDRSQMDRLAEVFRVIQEEAPDKMKALSEKAAQIAQRP
jgi:hypothetical protein